MSEAFQSQTSPLRDRRHFYRVTTRLPFRIIDGPSPARSWLYTEPGQAPFIYRPGNEELAAAEGRLAHVARRSANLSEGGMRIRFPEDGEEASVLRRAAGFRGPLVHIQMLLENEEMRTLFQLPVRVVRQDRLPWACFVALEFQKIPEGLRRRLEAFVLAVERHRLRHPAHRPGADGEAQADRLRRLEVAESQKATARRKEASRHKKRPRAFP
ncbi:MAG TPA: PilZ domain-containing protein [Gammaproteobacteria bacterium]|nr:PilZ domain-containing protein [Gammaproteobacteria bacterium]